MGVIKRIHLYRITSHWKTLVDQTVLCAVCQTKFDVFKGLCDPETKVCNFSILKY